MIATLPSDLRIAARRLLRTPGFTAVAVLTLALGIGATTAVFSVLDGMLLKRLPYHDPDRLVVLWESNPSAGLPQFGVAPANFFDWQRRATAFEGMTAVSTRNLVLTGTEEAERVQVMRTLPNYFAVTGQRPLHGRAFGPADGEGAPVAVLSHRLWKARYGADPAMVGGTIHLDGDPYTVVGVMPPRVTGNTQVWIPLEVTPELAAERELHFLAGIARLRPGLETEDGTRDIAAVMRALAAEHPATNDGWTAFARPLLDQTLGELKPGVMVVAAVAAVVLLIACGNLASLLLTRALSRERELAVCGALGATRGRVFRQLLAESAVLALAGGGLGVLLATGGVRLLLRFAPPATPRLQDVSVDGRMLGFALAVSALVPLVFGTVPAWRASRLELYDVLREGGRAGLSRRDRRLQGTMVVAQTSLAFVLLSVGAILLQRYAALRAVELGFTPRGVMTAQLTLPRSYAGEGAQAAVLGRIEERLRTNPAVASATIVDTPPLTPSSSLTGLLIEGRPEPEPNQVPIAYRVRATADHFRTLAIPVVRGRPFTPGDAPPGAPVIIIDEQFASRHFRGEDPVGRRITVEGDSVAREVVGVVGHVRQTGLEGVDHPVYYLPLAQAPAPATLLAVRPRGDAASAAAVIRREVAAVDGSIPLYSVEPLTARVDAAIGPVRFYVLLAATFAVIATVLAGIGVYGLLAYVVSRQTREIGIRTALGATRAMVVREVLGRGTRVVGTGVLLGAVLAVGGGRILKTLLAGAGSAGPGVLAGAAVLFLGVGLVAALLPALRAARVPPALSLRHDE
ncbi:MAG TPA: ABC transporter permease [Longimicrobiaceae bacterium]|nr:ABC transporter permease [Longimicrobiaceae bacterium]